jgi:hypothetical protein
MVEPEKKGFIKTKKKEKKNEFFNLGNPTDLEDTVRNLREENAKLLQLLRSRKFPYLLNKI